MSSQSQLDSERMRRYTTVLSNYMKYSDKEKEWLSENISLDFLKFLIEICINIENSNIQPCAKTAKFVKKQNKIYKTLLSKEYHINTKRRLLKQKGGAFIPAFLKLLAPTVIEYLLKKLN